MHGLCSITIRGSDTAESVYNAPHAQLQCIHDVACRADYSKDKTLKEYTNLSCRTNVFKTCRTKHIIVMIAIIDLKSMSRFISLAFINTDTIKYWYVALCSNVPLQLNMYADFNHYRSYEFHDSGNLIKKINYIFINFLSVFL